MYHRMIRSVDETLLIGRDIIVSPTDIDPSCVRLLARGRVLGGPDDGGVFEVARDINVGQALQIGPMLMVSVEAIKGERVQLGIHGPEHIDVRAREATHPPKTKGPAGPSRDDAD